MPPAVKVENLWFKYRTSRDWVLRSVNLELGEGELVGVTGPAAAGKTTLCMAISGLIPHYVPGHMEGIVRVHGLSTRETPIGQLSRIVQVVFQEASTQLVMSTVLEEIAYPLMNVLGYSASEAIAEARRVMGEMGILHLEDRNPKTCSGGEKQRILLALMTALRPRVMILDEATSDLDPEGSELVFNIAKRLREEGATIVMVTHDLDRLVEVADRIVVMDRGAILKEGPPEVVLRDFSTLQEVVRLPQIVEYAMELQSLGFAFEDIPLRMGDLVKRLAARGN